MQISKINMLNSKSNTIQNNNGIAQPLYRNAYNSDSVSFGSRASIARRVAGKVFLSQPGSPEVMAKLKDLELKDFADICEMIKFSSEPPRTACGINYNANSPQTIVNREEISVMATEAVRYIETKLKAIGEILQRTRKSDLPVADIRDNHAHGINFQIFPNSDNKSFIYRHNHENGMNIEDFEVIDGQLRAFNRTFPDPSGKGNYTLTLHFTSDGKRLGRISRWNWDNAQINMCVDDLHRTKNLFDDEAPAVITPNLEIKEKI